MKVFYHDSFTFPLPNKHRFPISKYQKLREEILAQKLIPNKKLLVGTAASDEQVLLVHDKEYLEKLKTDGLSDREVKRIGFPWSAQLLERARRSVGSTINACQSALKNKIAINLAGGTHHAFPDHGEGYCIFNDAAIAARVLQKENRLANLWRCAGDVLPGHGPAN
ncbi:MAG: hypothetical protein N2D54_05790 [Chloroflexota bacterium]